MTTQNSLFDTPLEPAVTHAMTLLDKPTVGMSKLQKDFIRYAQDIEAAQTRLAKIKALAQAQSSKREAALSKIDNQSLEIKHKTVLFLDARLSDKKGLTVNQRKMAARVICELAAELEGTPHGVDIQAIIQRHAAPVSAAEAAEMEEMKKIFAEGISDAMGFEIDPDDLDKDPQAMFDKLQQQMGEEAEQRFAKQAARNTAKKTRKKLTPKQQAAEDKAKAFLANKEQTLKTIYRKLSSALHPDRESDASLREQKNALMVDANKAYADKDLFALLRLQVKAQSYGNVGTAIEDEQLRQINTMLKNQLMDAQAEVREVEHHIRASFGMNYGVPITQEMLDRVLKADVSESLSEVKYMTDQFTKMQKDDKFLKSWLKEMDSDDMAGLDDLMFRL
jgi:hypothetical protein